MNEELMIVDNIEDVGYFHHPHRLDLMLISLVEQGSIGGKADMLNFRAQGPSLLFLFPDELIEYREASDDLRIKVIVMSKAFSKTLQTNESFSAFFRLKDNPIVKLQEKELELIRDYVLLFSKIAEMESEGKQQALQHLFTSFYYVVSHLQSYLDVVNVEKNRREQLFERFHATVVSHFKESREVQFYADKLCMTPKYMARIIKEISGKSANQWINEYVTLEARSLLLNHPEMSLLEISEELGFPNQSFFAQFFKKHTGQTPTQFKEI